MLYFLLPVIILSAAYTILLSRAWYLWTQIPEYQDTSDHIPHDLPGISVVIAARNEESHIQSCLKSITVGDELPCDYEIIVINDGSTDSTVDKVMEMTSDHIRLLDNPSSGKKTALSFGISEARFPVILCTDADCTVPQNWILAHSLFYQKFKNKNMCVGLVLPEIRPTALARFQWLDFSATMVMTFVGHYFWGFYLGNGAHLSFRKSAFFSVKGYETEEDIASGDDVFLVKKISEKFPGSIGCIKSGNMVVQTQPENSWQRLWQQRKRWATKARYVKDSGVVFVQSLVFLWVVFMCILIILGGLTLELPVLMTGFMMLIIKIVVDYYFLRSLANYFLVPEAMKGFVVSSGVYLVHIIKSGLAAIKPSEYHWKDRVVK
jgi:glycosyltransferase involved in cell wall biosynthesis